eukprot:1490791-Amphidinium_carterae.4
MSQKEEATETGAVYHRESSCFQLPFWYRCLFSGFACDHDIQNPFHSVAVVNKTLRPVWLYTSYFSTASCLPAGNRSLLSGLRLALRGRDDSLASTLEHLRMHMLSLHSVLEEHALSPSRRDTDAVAFLANDLVAAMQHLIGSSHHANSIENFSKKVNNKHT